jgi:hypothetical protein
MRTGPARTAIASLMAFRETATRPNLVRGRLHSDGGFPSPALASTRSRRMAFLGLLDVWADSRFWLLWLGPSHFAVRNCECRGSKSPYGSSVSSSLITISTGLGRPAAICFRQQSWRLPPVQGLAALAGHPVRDWARHLHRGSLLSTMRSERVQALRRRRNANGVGHVAAVRRLSLVVGGREYTSRCAYGRSVHVVLSAVWIVVAGRA